MRTLIVNLFNRLNYCAPIGDLILRCYVAYAFWQSGYVKSLDMHVTVQLFHHEYCVPILHPTFAAYLCAFIELVFPILLILGLAGRFRALVLFVLNIVAAVSYPNISDMGLQWHIAWGVMLLVVMLRGPGKLSLDHWLKHRYQL